MDVALLARSLSHSLSQSVSRQIRMPSDLMSVAWTMPVPVVDPWSGLNQSALQDILAEYAELEAAGHCGTGEDLLSQGVPNAQGCHSWLASQFLLATIW